VARGDILLRVDGEAVDNMADLMRALEEHEPGDEMELLVLHGDDERTLAASLGDRDGIPYLGLLPCGRLPGPGGMVTVRAGEPGAMITDVVSDGPADLAGLQAGDVIVAVDGQKLDSENNLADVIAAYEPGDTVILEVKRPGEESREVRIELGEHPEPEKEGIAYLGVHYRFLPPLHVPEGEALPFDWDWRPARPFLHRIPGGAVMQGAIVRHVAEDGPAAAAGLREGDLITAIEGDPVEGPRDLVDAIAEAEPGDRVTLTVYRPDDGEKAEEREVEVTLAEHPDEEGNAYLGVRIGGFFRMRHLEGDERLRKMDSFEPHFDWEAPFDELPFEFNAVPDHLEFHFPAEPFDGDEVNCCGGSI